MASRSAPSPKLNCWRSEAGDPVARTKKIVLRIGVLALQGDFREHAHVLRRLGAEANEVRLPQHLVGLDGLIMPGGESTTIGKLAVEYQLLEPLRDLAASGMPMWGTCAGLILLARDVGREQPLIGALDVTVRKIVSPSRKMNAPPAR